MTHILTLLLCHWYGANWRVRKREKESGRVWVFKINQFVQSNSNIAFTMMTILMMKNEKKNDFVDFNLHTLFRGTDFNWSDLIHNSSFILMTKNIFINRRRVHILADCILDNHIRNDIAIKLPVLKLSYSKTEQGQA